MILELGDGFLDTGNRVLVLSGNPWLDPCALNLCQLIHVSLMLLESQSEFVLLSRTLLQQIDIVCVCELIVTVRSRPVSVICALHVNRQRLLRQGLLPCCAMFLLFILFRLLDRSFRLSHE